MIITNYDSSLVKIIAACLRTASEDNNPKRPAITRLRKEVLIERYNFTERHANKTMLSAMNLNQARLSQ